MVLCLARQLSPTCFQKTHVNGQRLGSTIELVSFVVCTLNCLY